jgi:hypothetical protein
VPNVSQYPHAGYYEGKRQCYVQTVLPVCLQNLSTREEEPKVFHQKIPSYPFCPLSVKREYPLPARALS